MGRSCLPKCKLARIMGWLQIILGGLVILVSILSLTKFYFSGIFFQNEDICQHFYTLKNSYDNNGFDSNRIEEVLHRLEALQGKLELKVKEMEKNKFNFLDKKFLEEEIVNPLQSANVALRQIQIQIPEIQEKNSTMKENSLIEYFVTEEIRKYIIPKENRVSKINLFGIDKVYNSIGHVCFLHKKELEEYMDYDIGSYCDDDWNLGQKLMLKGCDPLPRRRCLTRASKEYQKPYPIPESLWKIPDHRNVRWGNYNCRNFECLFSKNPKRGYTKCTGCFEMEKEKVKWVSNSSIPPDFLISEVLAVKPKEIRVGLDYSIGTGTFAARMRENNVTIVTTALNLGAPFNEIIALRGLIPLYVTLNQRLPFFDNTMDLVHTTGLLDGWIDFLLLDFILYDWDRILRPGGLLWIDSFFCNKKDLDDFVYMFLQLRYKKHKWVVSTKSKDEVYLSALLEKPPRAI